MDKELFKMVLAFSVIISALSLFIVLLFVDVPTTIKDPLMVSFGVFIAKFQTVIDYFFGSSEGSNEKTKMLKGE
jgi:hypothetical protein